MKHPDFKPCALCGEGMMHTGIPLFYVVTVQRMKVDLNEVKRAHSYEQFLGNPALAYHMGPQRDLATPFSESVKLFICEACAIKPVMVACLNEVEEKPKKTAG